MASRLSQDEKVVVQAFLLDLAIGTPIIILGLLSGAASATGEAIRVVLLDSIDLFSVCILMAVNRHKFHRFEFGIEKIQILVQIVIAIGMCVSIVFVGGKVIEAFTAEDHLPDYTYCVLFALFSYVNVLVNVFTLMRMTKLLKVKPSIILRGQIRNRLIMLVSSVVATLAAAAVIIPDHKIFQMIDAIGAIIVLVVICYTMVRMLSGGMLALLDAPIDEKDKLKVYREIVERFDEWQSIAYVRTRQLGHNSYIEVGLCFDPARPLEVALNVCRKVQDAILAEMPQAFVWVHPAEEEGRAAEAVAPA